MRRLWPCPKCGCWRHEIKKVGTLRLKLGVASNGGLIRCVEARSTDYSVPGERHK